MNNSLKCQVVMLPIEEHIYPGKYHDTPVIWYSEGYNMKYKDKFLSYADMSLGYKPQHLYLVSDREIKEGNVTYDEVNQRVRMLERGDFLPSYSYIEATTDRSLGLPLIPQKWIEEVYVPTNGSIKEVKIDSYYSPTGMNAGKYSVKIHNNKVIILPIKDSWNREDLEKAYEAGYRHGRDGLSLGKGDDTAFKRWFDQNY